MTASNPIPYQGSKRKLAPLILPYIPIDTRHLIEPFAGSAALSIAKAQLNENCHFHINDLNKPLMSLWEMIIAHPTKIADQYRSLWTTQLGQEKEYYYLIRDEFNKTHNPAHFLYLLARCVKSAVRYNSNKKFNQSPDNRRRGTSPDTMQTRIINASKLFSGRVTHTSIDYWAILQDARPNDIVYLDPPYQGITKKNPRYLEHIASDSFVLSLKKLNERQIPYILSYDGRTGTKSFGVPLPPNLGLHKIELNAGRSSQATLLGRKQITYESLYLSPALVDKLPSHILPTRSYVKSRTSA